MLSRRRSSRLCRNAAAIWKLLTFIDFGSADRLELNLQLARNAGTETNAMSAPAASSRFIVMVVDHERDRDRDRFDSRSRVPAPVRASGRAEEIAARRLHRFRRQGHLASGRSGPGIRQM